jgi:hypothetical protein
MNTTAYASAHIDGELDCESLKVGVLATPEKTPVAFFLVIAGVQKHPVWAIGSLATYVYSYSQAARKAGQNFIEVNVTANLVSGNRMTCTVASKINWHTSSKIRTQAETTSAAMGGNNHGHSRSAQWPFQESMKIPVTDRLNEP